MVRVVGFLRSLSNNAKMSATHRVDDCRESRSGAIGQKEREREGFTLIADEKKLITVKIRPPLVSVYVHADARWRKCFTFE